MSHIRHDTLNERVTVQLFRVNHFAVDNAAFSKRLADCDWVNIRKIVWLGGRRLVLCVRLEHIFRFGNRYGICSLLRIPALFLRCQIAVLPDERTNLVIDLTPRQRYPVVYLSVDTALECNTLAIVIFAVTTVSTTAPAVLVFQKFDAFFLRMIFCIKLRNALFAALYAAAAAQHFVDFILRDKSSACRFKTVCGSIERCHVLSTLQTFCRIFGTLHIEAKAAKITVSLHSACVVRHFTGQYGAPCRVAQRCGQLLDSRRENIVSKLLCLCKKALLPCFFAHIMISVPDFRCKLAIFVRLCICQLCCTRILTVLQQRGDTISCIFISQYSSARRAGIVTACNTQTVAVKPEGMVNVMDAHARTAYAVFSPQECSSVRRLDIWLHEKSRDTLAAMGTVAACGQYAVDYLIGNIGRVPFEHIRSGCSSLRVRLEHIAAIVHQRHLFKSNSSRLFRLCCCLAV